ncbi:ABC1 family-domain-containing protein [Lipomyces oligophaga]|uniref:ABC1 family-domain-containing protein n=1 Tax=Lipomyces oligophaga TaxID=45792 RepID=UPI0034CE8D68
MLLAAFVSLQYLGYRRMTAADLIRLASAIGSVRSHFCNQNCAFISRIWQTSSITAALRKSKQAARQASTPSSSTVPNAISKTRSYFTIRNNQNVRMYSTPSDPPVSDAQSKRKEARAQMMRDRQNQYLQQRVQKMTESTVPTTRIGRVLHYGGIAAGMGIGALREGVRRLSEYDEAGSSNNRSLLMSPANLELLVRRLSRMRGAALKLGQMISFQDSSFLPPEIQTALTRVQDSADYMPKRQLDKVLTGDLGSNWRERFSSFDDVPMAAASIGQVHAAVLADSGLDVAVKVQYPGVADSISSDLNNIALLLTASSVLPKGLYLENTIANARTELAWECDYIREAENLQRFAKILENDPVLSIPKVFPDLSGKHVLTMERMFGIGVTRIDDLDQNKKNWIATEIMKLTLREISEFHYMQTDPNWTNFLYNESTGRIELLDFGASREYPDDFVYNYTGVLKSAVHNDSEGCEYYSRKLGYLTGLESPTMLKAHLDSILTLAEPFDQTGRISMIGPDECYDFANQTVTDRVRALIPVMIRERLTPPPEETYSLHRKLSGAFLLCARLNAKVPCKALFHDIVENVNSK